MSGKSKRCGLNCADYQPGQVMSRHFCTGRLVSKNTFVGDFVGFGTVCGIEIDSMFALLLRAKTRYHLACHQ